MKKTFLNLVAVCGFSLLAVNAYAKQGSKCMDMAGMKMEGMKMDKMPAKPASTTALSDGEVKAVDKENKSITLKNGRIKSAMVEMGATVTTFGGRRLRISCTHALGSFALANTDRAPWISNVRK